MATVGVAGDLERRVPVDLLNDRASETLSTWLQAHPGVEIISRDRAGAYALGARAGAPDAQQVPDRWHLLKNIGEVLERVLHQHRRAIDDAVSRDRPEPAEATTAAPALIAADAADTTVLLVGPATRSTSSVETSSAEVVVEEPRTARALAFEQVHVLHATGLSTRAVTKYLGLSRITVSKYLRAEQARAQNHRGLRPSVLQWRRGARPQADRAGDRPERTLDMASLGSSEGGGVRRRLAGDCDRRRLHSGDLRARLTGRSLVVRRQPMAGARAAPDSLAPRARPPMGSPRCRRSRRPYRDRLTPGASSSTERGSLREQLPSVG